MNKKLLAVLGCIMSLSIATFSACELPFGSSVCEHTYDNACDVDCNECGETRTVGDHVYDNICDAACNECGETRTVEGHAYDNACDAECNKCGDERTVGDHAYDNACDAECNVCGDERTVGNHAYDNACDTTCNECGETRTVGDHAYDNACDAACNECGETRTVGDHAYDNACDAACNECGDERTVGEHVYDNACDTTCNVCGDERTVAGHVYDNACDAECNVCDDERTVGEHVYDNDSDATCNECDATREIVTLSKRQDVDLDLTHDGNGLVMSSDNMTLELSEVANIASVSSITYNGVALEGASYAEGKIVAPKASFGTAFGEATVVLQAVNGDGADMLVNVPVLLISKAISNAEELDAMYAIAEALDLNANGKSYLFISDGYFVLDQNVAYNKAYTAWPTWDNASGKWRSADLHGFKGTIDGRGYTIDGMEISNNFNAFVTLLHAEGTIKNIGFNNAKISGIASALVSCWGGGTIENVYVQYAVGAFASAGGFAGTFFATDNVRKITAGAGLTIKDCYVDVSAITSVPSGSKKGWIGSYNNPAETESYVDVQGVYVLTTLYGLSVVQDVNSGTEVYKDFLTTADMLADSETQAELATWNTEYWTIVEGVPTWKTAHVYDNLCDVDCNECGATRVVGEHKYDNGCDIDCNICSETRTVTHDYDNACDAECNTCSETREVGDHVYDNACDVDCNECSATREVGDHVYDNDEDTECNECGASKSVITLSKRQDVDLDLTHDGSNLVVSNDNMTLELSEVANIASVSSVTYNGAAVENASYADGKLVAPKAAFGTAFGEATVVIQAVNTDGADMLINAPVLLITKAISNAEELDAWYTLADALDKNASGTSYAFISDGYFVLDQNVAYNKAYGAWPTLDAAGGKWRSADVHGFKGTLDGRGYTIEGLEINKNFNAFVTLLHAEGIIKNIGFNNAKVSSVASALVCCWGGGTLENVYVQYAAGTFGAAGGYNGTFFATDASRKLTAGGALKIYDCFVDASKITAEGTTNKSCFVGYAYGKQENIDLTVNFVTMHGVFALGAEGVNNKYAVYIPGEGDFYWPSATVAGLSGHGKSQTELATWNTDYWTIVEGIPTWNSVNTAA